jgi:serine/threonine protein kinase/tetratricopeptide (TPR) repeat protein
LIGKTISQYKILEHLGGGGMGVVYKAEDTRLKRLVALKFLPPIYATDPTSKERFIHEAQSASALQHSNICTIHDISETDEGQMYIVMDYYEGETLKKKIERGPLKIKETLDISLQVARGLEAAHEAKEIHRDIKPANIMVTEKGEVKIVDFGLAQLAGQTKLTQEGTTLGTVSYMSPEQTRGDEVDQRSDIWSLGVVLYEMISGQRPFKGDYDQAVMYSILNEQEESLTAVRTGVPPELERIIIKALSKNREERYPTVSGLIVDLKKVKSDLETSTKTALLDINQDKPARKKRTKILILASIVIIIITAAVFLKPLVFEEIVAGEPQPVVVISFKNQTGDPAYDYLQQAIPNLLITSLEQSKYLRVIPWERVYDILKQMGKEDVGLIDEEIGYEICRLEGVEAIVLGSYVKAGDMFATDVKVLDVQSKQLLKSASAKGEGVGSILQSQIDDLSRQISEHLVISETTFRSTALRIADMTTSSMEAYHYFLKGQNAYDKMYDDDARRFMEEAIRIDSTFAMAYLYLAWAHYGLRNMELRDQCYEKAKMYAYRAGEKDRMYIEAHYAARIEKNPQKRLKILEDMAKMYPKEKRVFYRLGLYYDGLKQYDKAIDTYNKALQLDPQFGPALNMLAYVYGDLSEFDKADEYVKRYAAALPGDANPFDSIGELYIRMGRMDEAMKKYKEALQVKPDWGSEWRMAYVCALDENYKDALKWIDSFISKSKTPGWKGAGYWWKGIYYYLTVNHKFSIENFEQSKKISMENSIKWGKARNDFIKSWIMYDRGEFDKSREHYHYYFEYRIKDSPQYMANHKADRAYFMGLIYLAQSKTDSAHHALQQIDDLYPQLTPIAKERHDNKREQLYVQILIKQDSLAKAESVWKNIKPLDRPFGFNWNYFVHNFPISQDHLAVAYIKHGLDDRAIEEYNQLIDKDIKRREWRLINPLYHYRLAKLYEEKNQTEKAEQEYKNFIEICSGLGDESKEILDAKKRLQMLENS